MPMKPEDWERMTTLYMVSEKVAKNHHSRTHNSATMAPTVMGRVAKERRQQVSHADQRRQDHEMI